MKSLSAMEKIAEVLEKDRRRRQRLEERDRRERARILAVEFGRTRGWIRAQGPFSLEQLGRRSNRIQSERTGFATDFVCYRDPSSRRPAAIALHVDPWPGMRPELDKICQRFGLQYEAVTDFPCWIDGTQFVVFTPADRVPEPSRPTSKKRRPRKMQLPLFPDWKDGCPRKRGIR